MDGVPGSEGPTVSGVPAAVRGEQTPRSISIDVAETSILTDLLLGTLLSCGEGDLDLDREAVGCVDSPTIM